MGSWLREGIADLPGDLGSVPSIGFRWLKTVYKSRHALLVSIHSACKQNNVYTQTKHSHKRKVGILNFSAV